jgi:hypothetical protein
MSMRIFVLAALFLLSLPTFAQLALAQRSWPSSQMGFRNLTTRPFRRTANSSI